MRKPVAPTEGLCRRIITVSTSRVSVQAFREQKVSQIRSARAGRTCPSDRRTDSIAEFQVIGLRHIAVVLVVEYRRWPGVQCIAECEVIVLIDRAISVAV